MKLKNYLLATMTLIGTLTTTLHAQNRVDFIPVPNKVEYQKGEFSLTKGTTIYSNLKTDFCSNYLQQHIKSIFDFPICSTVSKESNISLLIVPGMKEEEYQLTVNEGGITIKGSYEAGVFYGIQTLLQMFPPQVYSGEKMRYTSYSLPYITIEDAPRFPYRGFMLDVSRTFFDLEYVKQYLDWMAYHKMNRLQWHITDDNGWRLEIKKYPKLTSIGAWRGLNEPLKPVYGSGNDRYGGYYTQKEIKEIITYAAQRNITIIPDIDLPGHCKSATIAYPEVLCGVHSDIPSACGEFDNVWCVGNESNYKMLDNIIKEVAALFPCEYISIGGDEVVHDYWSKCPKCQDLMKREGMSSTKDLMKYFVKRMEVIVEKHGKKMMGFDDIQDNGGLNSHTAVVAWRSVAKGMESISKGHPTIMMPAQYLYVDMKYSKLEKGNDWAAIIPTETLYSYDPIGTLELTEEQKRLVLGPQIGLWTELMQYPPRFSEYQVFPRLCALAEIGWTEQENRNYNCFKSRLINHHYDRMANMGIAFRLDPPQVLYEGNILRVNLPYSWAEVRYTADKSEPTPTSPVYQGQIVTDTPENFRFATFFGRDIKSVAVGAENIELYHYQKPKTTIETNITVKEKNTLESIVSYNFESFTTTNQVKKGDYLTYIFSEPVDCKKITVKTGYERMPAYGIANGYVEYSYDGKNFIKGPDFFRYIAVIEDIKEPIKAIKITATDFNDGHKCVFQNLRIE